MSRAAKCPRPCDRLSSPPSVIFPQLRITRSETGSKRGYGLPFEAKNDGMESCKMPKAL